MKLLSWNVNGIRAAVRNGFSDFLKKNKPEVLGLQEIKIDSATKANTVFDFAGYHEFWNPAERPGYSGTALLVRDDLVPRIKKEINGMGIPEFDREGRVQTIEFDTFYVVNAYFPNSNHELSRLGYKVSFNKAYLAYVKKIEKKKPVLLCGDFNVAHREIDLKNPKTNVENAGFTPQERAWMDTFLKKGLIDTFRDMHPTTVQYSWWSYRFRARVHNAGWRIDYWLASSIVKQKIRKAFILDQVTGSDHCPVGIDISL